VYAFDVLRSRSFYPPWRVSFGAVLILSVLLDILSTIFTYWELDTDCLRQRKLWKVKEIARQDVTRIRRVGFSGRSVMICYGRIPEDCEYILANPINRYGFIAALRRFIPEAEFDVFEPTSMCKARKRPEN
jgi:hypothetical protein